VSRGPSFAIEPRERYHDVMGDRWPVAVAPHADELLSSWLHRLAFANGVAPRAFADVVGGAGGMWSARLDLRLPSELAAWLAARTGVASEAIAVLAMSDGAMAPLWLPQRETTHRRRATWLQFCALCLADDRVPYFRRCWRLASRVSCFLHGCGLRDRCPACRGGLAPFAQADLAPQHVCAHCGFDLRGAARISVSAAARRLERSVDDFSKAEIAKGPPAIHVWVGRLTRIPELAGLEPGRPLAELPASARIRCFERLAQSADEGAAAARARRRGPTRTAGGRDGLMGRFVDFVDARQRLQRAAPALDVDLTGLLAAYGHAARRACPAKLYRNERDRAA
jgi:hypothetical protein